MKTSTTRARNQTRAIGKLMIALAGLVVIGGTAVRPAFAEGNEGNDRRAEQQRQDRHREPARNEHDRRGDRDHQRRYVPEPVYPIYAPPPVYYAPQQSPGISLFLPLNIRVR